ncbi:hypothetical protein M413DRAFT_441161 [Hebeloma cylindrosporum]|uniref:Uncharacterized protein n=1 Tax=Hebeloma cylindrosporum TaxID=76867 RepID=A0A0C3CBF0_HEBCY|nr:hypothetical protein M413DRAFT_441161 [Hebeloma cylindrosporum h7]
MDYKPRFSQPFTLNEAIGLDVAVITEEMSRLQNSLERLRETQKILQEAISDPGEPDPEIKLAFEENQVVIGSQEERISMLKMALLEKGIVAGSHYGLTESLSTNPSPNLLTTTPTSSLNLGDQANPDDEGLHL